MREDPEWVLPFCFYGGAMGEICGPPDGGHRGCPLPREQGSKQRQLAGLRHPRKGPQSL